MPGKGPTLILTPENIDRPQPRMLIPARLLGRQFPPHPLQCHALHDHPSRPAQSSQKYSLAAEDRSLDAAHKLNVVLHALVESHDATRLDLNRLPLFQIELHEIAARVNEHR